MDNPEKLATYGTQAEEKTEQKIQHNMCWTPLYVNKLGTYIVDLFRFCYV